MKWFMQQGEKELDWEAYDKAMQRSDRISAAIEANYGIDYSRPHLSGSYSLSYSWSPSSSPEYEDWMDEEDYADVFCSFCGSGYPHGTYKCRSCGAPL